MSVRRLSVDGIISVKPAIPVEILDLIKLVLFKSPESRSYDDILLLKASLAKTDLIKKNLTGASPKLLYDLYRNSILESFEANEVVFEQDAIGDKVYIILAGKVEISARSEIDLGHGDVEIREKIFAVLTAGQYFGERALDLDEPRSGTALCLEHTDLFSISKTDYLIIRKSIESPPEEPVGLSSGSKEFVMHVLSKARHRRTPDEILAVATYLERRIPFFQKFKLDQRLELCRVLETISVWGRTVLFKQGTRGQAFYIILKGTVDVYVNNSDLGVKVSTPKTSKSIVTLEGLGDRVNQLNPGDIFGDRALESDSSLRMASVVTCENETQMIVVAKEDYLNLVSFIMHSDTMEKIAVLRKTPIFQNVDGVHLRSFAKFLFPRKFRLDDIIYQAGDRMIDMLVISAGECRAEIEVVPEFRPGHVMTKTTAAIVKKGKQVVNLGRIAPFSVLGTAIALADNIADEIYAKETIIATSLVTLFALSKSDFLLHLPADSRTAISNAIRHFETPLMPQLWEFGPRSLDDKDWRVGRAWDTYREEIVQSKKDPDIIRNFRSLTDVNVNIGPNVNVMLDQMVRRHGTEYQSTERANQSTHSQHTLPSINLVVGLDWGTPAAIAREKEHRKQMAQGGESLFGGNRDHTSSSMSEIYKFEDDSDVQRALERAKRRDLRRKGKEGLSPSARQTKSLGQGDAALVMTPIVNSNSQLKTKTISSIELQFPIKLCPFSLVQFHREPVHARGTSTGVSVRRMVRCHMRLCGTVQSCLSAKELAYLIMKNAYLTTFNSDLSKEDELILNWRVFHGFESIPLQNSDHFLVYCKNTPLEYASLSPSKTLLLHEYPPACKAKGQRFACVLSKEITPNLSSVSTSSILSNSKQSKSPKYGNAAATATVAAGGLLNNLQDQSMNRQNALQNVTKPMFLSEISAVVETVCSALTQVDCLRYILFDDDTGSNLIAANNSSNRIIKHNSFSDQDRSSTPQKRRLSLFKRLQNNPGYVLCLFPLYEWIIVDQESIDLSNIQQIMNNSNSSNLTENFVINAKLSKKYAHDADDEINRELQVSLKESGLLINNIRGGLTGSEDKSNIFSKGNPSLKFLEKEMSRRDISLLNQRSNQSSSHDISIQTTQLHTTGNDATTSPSKSFSSTSLSALKAQKKSDLELTQKKLDAMKTVVQARLKILALNDTLCTSETALSKAFQLCREEGLPIQAIKFKKLGTAPDEIAHSENDDTSTSGSTAAAISQQAVKSATKFTLSRSSLGLSTRNVFTVDEKTLRTIEHSLKDPLNLKQEINLGLGLLQKRSEMYDSLISLPTFNSVMKTKDKIQDRWEMYNFSSGT